MHGSYKKSTLVSTTTTSGCTDQISRMILQEIPPNLDPENNVKDNFNYEVSSYSAEKFISVYMMSVISTEYTVSSHTWFKGRSKLLFFFIAYLPESATDPNTKNM